MGNGIKVLLHYHKDQLPVAEVAKSREEEEMPPRCRLSLPPAIHLGQMGLILGVIMRHVSAQSMMAELDPTYDIDKSSWVDVACRLFKHLTIKSIRSQP